MARAEMCVRSIQCIAKINRIATLVRQVWCRIHALSTSKANAYIVQKFL